MPIDTPLRFDVRFDSNRGLNQLKLKTMETKHTKGQWHIESQELTKHLYSVVYCGDIRIAEVKSFGKNEQFNDATIEEKEANAKLIAAAPELLVALIELEDKTKMIMSQLVDSPKEIIEDITIQKAINAIKKATE